MLRVHRTQLDNYTKDQLEELLGDIKQKPWLPVQLIKDEFVNCLQFKYGSLSENDFKYDKGLYGWFNIMKFSCAEVHEGFYIFAMAFSRTRFRLKQVYLRRQNKLWATSGRTIISRDIQKMVELFCIEYCQFVLAKLKDELSTLNSGSKRKERQMRGSFLRVPREVYAAFDTVYPPSFKHTSASISRRRTFSTMAIPIRSRIIIAKNSAIHNIVENLSQELTDESCDTLDSCRTTQCFNEQKSEDSYANRTETYSFVWEKALYYQMTSADSLLSYQKAKSYFNFGKSQRKTVHGIINVTQQMDDDAKQIRKELLEQQFSVAIRMHAQPFFSKQQNDLYQYQRESQDVSSEE